MELTLALKLKLKVSSEQAKLLNHTMKQFTEASNYVSNYYFEHMLDKDFKYSKLHQGVYQNTRSYYQLKSQMACSVERNVQARYKTTDKQLQKVWHSYPLQDKNGNILKDKNQKTKKKYYHEDKSWLIKPIHFKKPQLLLQRGRDWSFTKDNKLSINTLSKRIKVRYSFKRPAFDNNQGPRLNLQDFVQTIPGFQKFGSITVLHIGNKYYVMLTVNVDVPENEVKDWSHLVGIDRGIRFLVVGYDDQGKYTFMSGKKLQHQRRHIKQERRHLQAKNTKSAHRKLKTLSQRENRLAKDVNHCLTKALANKYGVNTTFVLENLVELDQSDAYTGIDKAVRNSWAYYGMEQDLVYKGLLRGQNVIEVDKNYTSQRCPKCGCTLKSARNHDLHLYICLNCGYKCNDDGIAGQNLFTLGKKQLETGVIQHYTKTKAEKDYDKYYEKHPDERKILFKEFLDDKLPY